MHEQTGAAATAMRTAITAYRNNGSFPDLLTSIGDLARAVTVEELIHAAEPYVGMPEVAGPVYEYVVDVRPDDARALVVLASSYWLTGRGPEVVGELASRAISADPSNRGAWHMWALTEGDQRRRMERWLQVTERFPDDELARASLADNATSLASAENDPVAMSIAIDSFEKLLASATRAEQKESITNALNTLRGRNR
jgi:hypothetical protein